MSTGSDTVSQAEEEGGAVRPAAAAARSPFRVRFREDGIVFFVILLIGVFWLLQPRFLDVSNIEGILDAMIVLLPVAVGQTVVIITRNYDISVGSEVAVSAMATATLLSSFAIPWPLAFVLGIAIGAGLGAVNGVMVAYLGISSIVATLGTMGLYAGLAFWVDGGQQIDPNQLPQGLLNLSGTHYGIPVLFVIGIVLTVAVAIMLRRTRYGRACYAVGDNPEAAVLRGIFLRRTVFLALILSGVLAGIAGILYISQFGTVNPADVGSGVSLESIAVVVIGGTNALGGSGRVRGTFFGAALLSIALNGLYVTKVSAYWQQALIGAIILLAVILDGNLRRRTVEAAIRTRRHT